MITSFFVGNVSYELTESDLVAVLQSEGFEVASVRIIRDRATGNSKGFGFVDLEIGNDDVDHVVDQLTGIWAGGRPLRASPAERPNPNRNGAPRVENTNLRRPAPRQNDRGRGGQNDRTGRSDSQRQHRGGRRRGGGEFDDIW